jgi:hypothetical protein
MPKLNQTNGVWKAINENTYQWGDYKLVSRETY